MLPTNQLQPPLRVCVSSQHRADTKGTDGMQSIQHVQHETFRDDNLLFLSLKPSSVIYQGQSSHLIGQPPTTCRGATIHLSFLLGIPQPLGGLGRMEPGAETCRTTEQVNLSPTKSIHFQSFSKRHSCRLSDQHRTSPPNGSGGISHPINYFCSFQKKK